MLFSLSSDGISETPGDVWSASFTGFHDEEGLALEFCDVMDGADVRMIQRRYGARLTLKPCAKTLVDVSPDGRSVAYESNESGVRGTMRRRSAATRGNRSCS